MQTAPQPAAAETTPMKYWAFISYSSRDEKRWALPLRKRLESYRVPKALAGKLVHGEVVPRYLRPVFRDREELSAGPDLPQKIRDALKVSRYLIVICSPHAKSSAYVGQEILWFKRYGRSDRVITYVVDGEPPECFREELLYEVDEWGELRRDRAVEPLAADARPGRDGKDAALKVLAGMLGASFDELKRRELIRRQRLLMAAISVTLSIAAVLSALSVWALIERDRANKQTIVAQNNEQEATYQKTIAEQNEELAVTQRNLALAQKLATSAPQPREADLVVGADGLHSRVRQLAFGPEEAFEVSLGYHVAAFDVAGYRPRDVLVFLSHAAPGRQISRWALRDDRTLFLFVFRDEYLPAERPADEEGRKEVLARVFADVGWECPRILAAMRDAGDVYFDGVSQIRLDRWAKGRTVLVGDAAACISLMGGEGTGLAMTEAYVLAGELHRCGDDLAAALTRYQERLMPLLKRKQQMAARFASSFAPGTALGIRFRNALTRLLRFPVVVDYLFGSVIGSEMKLPDYGL